MYLRQGIIDDWIQVEIWQWIPWPHCWLLNIS